MIEVVSGVCIRDGRVFLTQRKVSQSYPMMWETPGGKVDECDREATKGWVYSDVLRFALQRELEEELWAGFSMRKKIAPTPFFVTEFEQGVIETGRGIAADTRISFFLVELEEGVWPVGNEGQGSGWFSVYEMRHLPMLPGNERAMDAIQREVSTAGERQIEERVEAWKSRPR